MGLCSNDCFVRAPEPLQNRCRPVTRNGGISRILIFDCALQFKDIYDIREWCEYIQTKRITVSGEILGQKPKANATRKKTNSCRGEQVIGFDYSVTFQDYNADNLDFSDYDFWNTIQSEYQRFQVAFLTCDGHLYGYNEMDNTFIHNFTIEVSNVIEDDYNGSSFWDGTIEWKGKYEYKPMIIPGIERALFSNDCNSLSSPYNYNPYNYNPGSPYNYNPPIQNCRIVLIKQLSYYNENSLISNYEYELPCDCDNAFSVEVTSNINEPWYTISPYPNTIECLTTNTINIETVINTVGDGYNPDIVPELEVTVVGQTNNQSYSTTTTTIVRCMPIEIAEEIADMIVEAFKDTAWTDATLVGRDFPGTSFQLVEWWINVLNQVDPTRLSISLSGTHYYVEFDGERFPVRGFIPQVFVSAPSEGYFSFYLRACTQTVWVGLTYRVNDHERWSLNPRSYGVCIGNFTKQTYDPANNIFDGVCV